MKYILIILVFGLNPAYGQSNEEYDLFINNRNLFYTFDTLDLPVFNFRLHSFQSKNINYSLDFKKNNSKKNSEFLIHFENKIKNLKFDTSYATCMRGAIPSLIYILDSNQIVKKTSQIIESGILLAVVRETDRGIDFFKLEENKLILYSISFNGVGFCFYDKYGNSIYVCASINNFSSEKYQLQKINLAKNQEKTLELILSSQKIPEDINLYALEDDDTLNIIKFNFIKKQFKP